MTKHDWPDREEWAKRQRTPYLDLFENLLVSRKLADCATPAEVQAVIA